MLVIKLKVIVLLALLLLLVLLADSLYFVLLGNLGLVNVKVIEGVLLPLLSLLSLLALDVVLWPLLVKLGELIIRLGRWRGFSFLLLGLLGRCSQL